MILLYLLLASSGLGFESGYGIGLAGELPIGPWAVYGQGEWLDQDKVESPGWRASGQVEGRYGRRWFVTLGASVRGTHTERWSKVNWSPLVGGGWRGQWFRATVRAYLPDNSTNSVHGIQGQAEYTGRPCARATYGYYWYGENYGHTASLGLGWRWR